MVKANTLFTNTYFTIAKYWQNIDNRYNALVTIGNQW